MSLEKTVAAPCTLAMRVEGSMWNAYLAPTPADDANRRGWVLIGSIALGFIDKGTANTEARFQEFKNLMVECMHDAIETALKQRPVGTQEWPTNKSGGRA